MSAIMKEKITTEKQLRPEQCWLLLGDWEDNILWWAVPWWMAKGGPTRVTFDAGRILRREKQCGGVVGFYHTHPGMPAAPSETDHKTMRAWVTALGKGLVCV